MLFRSVGISASKTEVSTIKLVPGETYKIYEVMASNYEDIKQETDALGIKLVKTEGAQYIKLTRDGQGALAFVKQQFED